MIDSFKKKLLILLDGNCIGEKICNNVVNVTELIDYAYYCINRYIAKIEDELEIEFDKEDE